MARIRLTAEPLDLPICMRRAESRTSRASCASGTSSVHCAQWLNHSTYMYYLQASCRCFLALDTEGARHPENSDPFPRSRDPKTPRPPARSAHHTIQASCLSPHPGSPTSSTQYKVGNNSFPLLKLLTFTQPYYRLLPQLRPDIASTPTSSLHNRIFLAYRDVS